MKLGSIRLEWVALAAALIYIVLLQECKPNVFGGGETVDTLSYRVDTVRITHVDTIELPPITRTVKVTVPTPVYIHDTVILGDSAVVTEYAEYTTDVNDSLIEGRVISKVSGTLLSQSLEYTPKFPKYILRTDTVLVKESTVVNKQKLFLYVGGELGGSAHTFNLSPLIGVSTKKGYMYGYRYGLVDKTHNISFSKKLSFKLRF